LEQLLELSEIQEYTIKPLLRTVRGIADINESGGYERQFVVEPKPDALEEVGMTFSELAALIEQNVENAGGGIISRGGEQLTIRAVSRVTNAGEIAAQALYNGQSLLARSDATRALLDNAAHEERDHLAWCATRIVELGGRTSLLTPGWQEAL